MDCTDIRKGLMNNEFTSVDLVNFFGERCQRIGRDLGLTCEELFHEAMEKALDCDKQRA